MTEQQLTIVSLKTDTIQDLVGKIGRWHQSAISLATQSLDFAFKCGQALLEAKARVDHGRWLGWLAESCPNISERQAQRYMRVTQERPAIEAVVCDGPITIDGALSLIATPRPNTTETSYLESEEDDAADELPPAEMEWVDPDERLPHESRTAAVAVEPVTRSPLPPVEAKPVTRAQVGLDEKPKSEVLTWTQADINDKFQAMSKLLGEVVTKLGRLKIAAMEMHKRVGNGESLMRTIDADVADKERLNKMIGEWSRNAAAL